MVVNVLSYDTNSRWRFEESLDRRWFIHLKSVSKVYIRHMNFFNILKSFEMFFMIFQIFGKGVRDLLVQYKAFLF